MVKLKAPLNYEQKSRLYGSYLVPKRKVQDILERYISEVT